LTVVLVCLAAQPLRACLNSLSATTLDGHKVRQSDIAFWEIRDSRKRDMTVEGAEMERKFRGKCDFTNRNDYAVALVFLGRHDEAISLLQSLEKETPNHYSTAANLGTAYELSGNNELALQWIEEGIRRNPRSHKGSELVHVEILRAKIQQQSNPDYFQKHSVLNFDANAIKPKTESITVAGMKRTPVEVRDAIHYQLGERLQFVKSKDPVVASLLFDYGALEAATRTVESGRRLMQMAVEFGYPREEVAPFYARFDHAILIANLRRFAFYGSIGLGVLAVSIYAVRRRWIRLA